MSIISLQLFHFTAFIIIYTIIIGLSASADSNETPQQLPLCCPHLSGFAHAAQRAVHEVNVCCDLLPGSTLAAHSLGVVLGALFGIWFLSYPEDLTGTALINKHN